MTLDRADESAGAAGVLELRRLIGADTRALRDLHDTALATVAADDGRGRWGDARDSTPATHLHDRGKFRAGA